VRELGNAALAAHLTRWGDALLAGGEVGVVVDAVDALPEEPPHARTCGGWPARPDRCGATGPAQLAYLHRAADLHAAAGDAERLPPALVWRLGLIYYFRGELDEALRVFLRRRRHRRPRRRAAAELGRRHVLAAPGPRQLSRRRLRALALATESGDDAALAEAHATRGDAGGDGRRPDRQCAALRPRQAVSPNAPVTCCRCWRVRNNIGSRLLEEGDYRAAVVEFDDVIRLAERTGYASLLALASHNRGTAHSGLGRLHEAASDFEAALRTYEAIESRMAAYPLTGLGDVLRLSGDLLAGAGLLRAGDRRGPRRRRRAGNGARC
jgi:tetratricopeptide (TPR) repeat protein